MYHYEILDVVRRPIAGLDQPYPPYEVPTVRKNLAACEEAIRVFGDEISKTMLEKVELERLVAECESGGGDPGSTTYEAGPLKQNVLNCDSNKVIFEEQVDKKRKEKVEQEHLLAECEERDQKVLSYIREKNNLTD